MDIWTLWLLFAKWVPTSPCPFTSSPLYHTSFPLAPKCWYLTFSLLYNPINPLPFFLHPFSLNDIPAHPTPSSPPSSPPFLLFALFMSVPLLPASSLTLIHCMSLFYYALHHLSLLHPHPHFHFFGLIMVIPLPSTHFPYSFTSYTTVLPYCNPLDNPLHPLLVLLRLHNRCF